MIKLSERQEKTNANHVRHFIYSNLGRGLATGGGPIGLRFTPDAAAGIMLVLRDAAPGATD
jgi:hypothetical protein